MTTDIFIRWFECFCKTVTARPLIVVYDGHVTHLNYEVITKAREENISIIKLPPHTTDRLQPLDVTCFRSLQSRWDKAIHDFNSANAGTGCKKYEFTTVLGPDTRNFYVRTYVLYTYVLYT